MPHSLSGHAALDSLSNLAASLNAGKDKQAGDAFFIPDLGRDQIESLYRGDWLARKIVDIVPYDCVREWREWAGDPADVRRIEDVEARLTLRRAVQRAMVMGRLYGGGALIVGTRETDPAALAGELRPEMVGANGITFLHAVSRWQLGVAETDRDPLSPWFGEPKAYEVAAPERGALTLHPTRVIRFLGNPLADPALFGTNLWSDSVLTTLYDAIHAVALTTTGATSLMHEAKVDVVTVPNLSEHLANAATTAQLSARFSYAATMKSLNNLLLLGDGETWTRQHIDFAGLPEMVRTVLQVAAGAADIPVTRLLGQSPAGLSATGDSDIRNYYDMIAARQAIELRPQLERLDRLLLASARVAPGALSFSFRPLWQMDAAAQATIALQKAQATQIYAGLGLWPTEVMAGLVEGQLAEDGTYPNAGAVFSRENSEGSIKIDPVSQNHFTADWPGQPHDPRGLFAEGKMAGDPSIIRVAHFWEHEKKRRERRLKRERKERERPEEEAHEPKNNSPIPSERTNGSKAITGSTSKSQNHPINALFASPSIIAPPPPEIFQPTVPASVGPGPFARATILAGPSRRPSAGQQALINEIGSRFGCHTCGTMNSGDPFGNWVGDHQPPTALNISKGIQFYLPHCVSCSKRQGGRVSGVIRNGFRP